MPVSAHHSCHAHGTHQWGTLGRGSNAIADSLIAYNIEFSHVTWSAHRGACSHDAQIGALLGAPSRETPQMQNLAMELRKVG